MSTKRKSNSRRPASNVPAARIIRNPAKPLKPLLDILTEVARSADLAFAAERLHETGPDSFDIVIFLRGVNLIKAIVMLSDQLHWEVAASSARQLFELLVNMEALAAMPDREEAMLRYTAYGLLQKLRARVVEDEYKRATGRPVDDQETERIASMLAWPMFEKFKGKPKADGSINWASSWNGRSTKEMAIRSPNELRESQYNQLFVAWSEETHAAPGALINGMFEPTAPPRLRNSSTTTYAKPPRSLRWLYSSLQNCGRL